VGCTPVLARLELSLNLSRRGGGGGGGGGLLLRLPRALEELRLERCGRGVLPSLRGALEAMAASCGAALRQLCLRRNCWGGGASQVFHDKHWISD
jgi:hypothetical protein